MGVDLPADYTDRCMGPQMGLQEAEDQVSRLRRLQAERVMTEISDQRAYRREEKGKPERTHHPMARSIISRRN